MRISLQLLLDELSYEYDRYGEESENPDFEFAELLTEQSCVLPGRRLIICLLSEALPLPKRGEGLYFLCIRDRLVAALETPEAMRGITVIRKNLKMPELFNEVQRVFTHIGGWQSLMQRSVMQNKGMQDLLDLSESVLRNHIAVMDSTFKLLAYTKNVETDDPMANELIRLGYHPEKAVEKFRLTHRLEQFQKADGIVVSDDHLTSKYVTVKKVFRDQDTYSILVVMICCVRKYSEGLRDLFSMLLENIQVYVEREYMAEDETGPVKALVGDLLDGKIRDPGEARVRASNAGLPFEAAYDLLLLQFRDTQNIAVRRLVRDLSLALPLSKAVAWRQGILVLNRYEKAGSTGREERLARVNDVTGTHSFSGGVSNSFPSIWELPAAYEQAAAAIRFGERIHSGPAGDTAAPDRGKLYAYEDYFLHHLIAEGLARSPEVFRNSFLFRAAETLSDYDQKSGTEYLRLLRAYLRSAQRATETGAMLHMHRNTVLYHISRIEDVLGVSLEDPEVRLKLSLCFKVLELEG
jgi:sugar diacid utilization regulator